MKHFKQIILTGLSLSLALGTAGALAACGEGGGGKDPIEYSVTVTCEDPAVLADIEVELTTAAGLTAKGGEAKALTNSKATFEAAPGTYRVELSGVPEEYTWEPATVSEAKPDVTVALTLDDTDVTYTVTVVDPDEEPVAGVLIQICTVGNAGGCYGDDTTVTDAQGKVEIEAPEASYEVHILEGIPEGLDYDNEVDGPDNILTAEGRSITVRLYRAPIQYTVTVTCGDAVVLANLKAALKTEDGLVAKGGEAKALDENGKATFTITPGDYTVEITDVPDGYTWNEATMSETDPIAAIALTLTTTGRRGDPHPLSLPFAGKHILLLPAYKDNEATAYVYYSYTATETAIYTLSYDSAFSYMDVSIAANGQHATPIATWNIAAESYAFQLKQGTTYSFRFADGRATASGGEVPLTVTKTGLSIPADYAGTWTDVPKAETPKWTVVFTDNNGNWTVTLNNKTAEPGLADRGAGFILTYDGDVYSIALTTDDAGISSLQLAWGNDRSVFLFKEGDHPAPGTQLNPIKMTQEGLVKAWSVETDMEGKYYTFTATETKAYTLTVTSVSKAKCEAVINLDDGDDSIVGDWSGAADAKTTFTITSGKTYILNVAITDPTDETGKKNVTGTVAFTIAEGADPGAEGPAIPDEILAIDWVCETNSSVKLTLTKTTVLVSRYGFESAENVTSVEEKEGKTVITYGSKNFTLTYDPQAKTLTAVQGSNTFVFKPKEDKGGAISLPEGWRGTWQLTDFGASAPSQVVTITENTITWTTGAGAGKTFTITDYDETNMIISFKTDDGLTGTIERQFTWDTVDNITAIKITLNGTAYSNLKQAT